MSEQAMQLASLGSLLFDCDLLIGFDATVDLEKYRERIISEMVRVSGKSREANLAAYEAAKRETMEAVRTGKFTGGADNTFEWIWDD